MFAKLPIVLQSLVCEFAYDANLDQTKRALEYILHIKSLNLHPLVLRDFVHNYNGSKCPLTYSRLHQTASFFAPWTCTPCTVSPLTNFFVWFSRAELFDLDRVSVIVNDLDMRLAKKLFTNCPICIQREAKMCLIQWLNIMPIEACRYIGTILRNVRLDDLRLHPTTLSRYMVSHQYDENTILPPLYLML